MQTLQLTAATGWLPGTFFDAILLAAMLWIDYVFLCSVSWLKRQYRCDSWGPGLLILIFIVVGPVRNSLSFLLFFSLYA